MNTLKAIFLFFCWLLFSPMYFIFSKIMFKTSLGKRSFWTVFSPFTIVLVLVLCFPLKEAIQYTNRSSIYRISQAELPSKVIYDIDGFFNFSLRDHTTTCFAYFWRMPTEGEYAKLDSLCSIKSSHWSKRVNDGIDVYSYSCFWGNGVEAPKGESGNDDRTLDISFSKGDKKVVITYGSW